MKNHVKKLFYAFLLATLLLGLVPLTAYAASPNDIVIGNSYTLGSGETLNDDLLIIGGSVILMPSSTVNGTVFVLGGRLDAAGTVNGDIIIFGGTVRLADTFEINGNISTAGASVSQDPAAQINGQLFRGENLPQVLTIPGGIQFGNLGNFSNPGFRAAGFFFRLFLWVLVAMVAAMFLPAHLTRVSRTAQSEPLISGGLGCLTVIIVPIVLLLLAITICLIPVSILGGLVLALAWAYGLVALGLEVGKRISGIFNREWHPAIAAGAGMLVLMLLLSGLETLIPCVGWIPKALVGFLGLGAVLLTQFGMKAYPYQSVVTGGTSSSELPDEIPGEALPPQTPPENQ